MLDLRGNVYLIFAPVNFSDVGQRVKQSSERMRRLTPTGSKFDWEWVWRLANTPRTIIVLNVFNLIGFGQLLE